MIDQNQRQEQISAHKPKVDILATSIATGVTASIVMQAGKGIFRMLVRQPVIMFSLGMATGYFSYKYRREIVSVGGKAIEQGKEFVLRQQESLKGLTADSAEEGDD